MCVCVCVCLCVQVCLCVFKTIESGPVQESSLLHACGHCHEVAHFALMLLVVLIDARQTVPVHFKVSSLHCDCPPSVVQRSKSSSVSRCSRKSVTRVDPVQPHVGVPVAPATRSITSPSSSWLPTSLPATQSWYTSKLRRRTGTAHCPSHLLSSRRLPASESALSTSSLHRKAIGTI